MRNTNRRFDLWKIQSSDCPADMRKSIPDLEMWQSELFAPRGGACARLARDVFSSSRKLRRARLTRRGLAPSMTKVILDVQFAGGDGNRTHHRVA
jgi:hypothetical protein